jgi:hypothetical protein
VTETRAVQCRPDGAHPAVHHVAGRDDVGTGFCVTDRRAGEQGEGWIVQHARATRVALHDAAMPVAHVFAQADIGDDQQAGQFFLQQPDGLLDDAVARIGAGGPFILARGNAEQQHRGDAGGEGQCRVLHQFVR